MTEVQEDIPMPWLKTSEGIRAIHLNYEHVSPFEFVKRRGEQTPKDPAIIPFKGNPVSCGELLTSIKKFQVVLKELGIVKGDRVAIMLPNTPHYVIAHYAILSMGAIVVQANPLYTERELKHQMDDSGSKLIITLTSFQEKANIVMKETALEKVVLCNIGDYMKTIIHFLGSKILKKFEDPKMKTLDNNFNFIDLMNKADISKFEEAQVDIENDVAILQYTGGTTGVSKGAMLTHKNVSYNAQQSREIFRTVPEGQGSVLTALPMFHSFGLTACMNISFQLKVPMVLMIRFNVPDALKLIESQKITFFPGVPTMLIAMLHSPDVKKFDLSSLIAVISGGAPLPIQVAREFKQITGGDLVEGYGLSETSPVVFANPIGSDKFTLREGSVGIPAPDTICKITDSEDPKKNLPLGEVGEICLKGPQVMRGYWNREEETAKTLIDGWLHTGDIGRLDEDGYLYIVDRKKDLIIVSGFNVVPREVEEVLYENPKVLEAAVAGLPHEEKGEMVTAWIVLKTGETSSKEEIREYCKEKLAPYKVPREVYFKDELPKSMIGKVLRRKLVEEYTKK